MKADLRSRALITVGMLLLLSRLLTLGVSDFGDNHGFNEAVYFDIASNYEENPLSPRGTWSIHGTEGWFYDTPPLTTYAIAASHAIFGATEFATRFPSLVALSLACVGSALLAGSLAKKNKEAAASAGFALAAATPWLLAWGGRAQTDVYMATAAVWAVVAMVNHGKSWAPWLLFASTTVGLLAKQTFPLVFVAFFFLPEKRQAIRRLWLPALAGFALNGAWWIWQWSLHPDSVMASLHFHLEGRAAPFGNWPLTLFWGILVGMAPLLLCLRWKTLDWRAVAPAGAFLAFSLWNAPIAHQYYTIPAAPLLAGAAGAAIGGRRLILPALALGALLGAFLLASWGDLGSHRVEEIGEAMPEEGTVTVPTHIAPQLRVYSGRDVLAVETWQPEPRGWIVSYGREDCPLVHEAKGHGPPIRLYNCPEEPEALDRISAALYSPQS